MEDPVPTDTILEDNEVRYEIVESGTRRGGKYSSAAKNILIL